jgi:hypothetical protein
METKQEIKPKEKKVEEKVVRILWEKNHYFFKLTGFRL